jgi:hypothetical protein
MIFYYLFILKNTSTKKKLEEKDRELEELKKMCTAMGKNSVIEV